MVPVRVRGSQGVQGFISPCLFIVLKIRWFEELLKSFLPSGAPFFDVFLFVCEKGSYSFLETFPGNRGV